MQGRNAAMIARYFPGYRSPKAVYQDVLGQSVQAGTVWLDIGCGKRVCVDDELNAELPRRAQLTVGCDRDPYLSKHTSINQLVVCDAAALPFRSGTFSLVTAAMVFEHLEHPEAVFSDVSRILKPGGSFVVFTPNRFNYAMLVAAVTPYGFHVLWKKLTHFFARGEWRDFSEDVFPTWYRANSIGSLRALLGRAALREKRLQRLSLAHSFGFVRPLYALSLLFERLIDRCGLDVLKADILGVYVREQTPSDAVMGASEIPRLAAVGGRA